MRRGCWAGRQAGIAQKPLFCLGGAGREAWGQGGSLSSPPGRRHFLPYKVLSLPQTAPDQELDGVVGGGARASSGSYTLLTHPPAPGTLSGTEGRSSPGLLETTASRWLLKTQAQPGNQDSGFPSLPCGRGCPLPSVCPQGVRAEHGLPSGPPLPLPCCSTSPFNSLPTWPGKGPKRL